MQPTVYRWKNQCSLVHNKLTRQVWVYLVYLQQIKFLFIQLQLPINKIAESSANNKAITLNYFYLPTYNRSSNERWYPTQYSTPSCRPDTNPSNPRVMFSSGRYSKVGVPSPEHRLAPSCHVLLVENASKRFAGKGLLI